VDESVRLSPGFERHAITVLTLVMVALILWVGNGVQQTQVRLAAMEVELAYIKRGINGDTSKFSKIEERLDNIEKVLHQRARVENPISQ